MWDILVRSWGLCEGHQKSSGHSNEEEVETVIFVQKSGSDEPYSQRNGPVILTVILESDSHGHLFINVGHFDSHIGSLGHDCNEASETIVLGQKSALY